MHSKMPKEAILRRKTLKGLNLDLLACVIENMTKEFPTDEKRKKSIKVVERKLTTTRLSGVMSFS